jgi:hypothetical protein
MFSIRMIRPRTRALPLLVATVAALTLTLGLGLAKPAAAAPYVNYPYQKCVVIGFATEAICTAWTGGYPNGYVRAETATNYYGVKLLKCTNCAGLTGWSWVTAAVATNYPGYTPSVRAGKTVWYKSCHQRFNGGPWACVANRDAVYLGD